MTLCEFDSVRLGDVVRLSRGEWKPPITGEVVHRSRVVLVVRDDATGRRVLVRRADSPRLMGLSFRSAPR
jgi:hypothetical protein